MTDNTLNEAYDRIRFALEHAAAEKADTVVDLSDPYVRGPYLHQVREAGNAAIKAAVRDGSIVLEGCYCSTPDADAMIAVDETNIIKVDILHRGEVMKTLDIKVSATLDYDGDGQ